MSDLLVPVLPAIKRCRLRREKDKDQIDCWHKTSYNNTSLIFTFTWIDQFTEGWFYLDSEIIAFEDEKDFTIFKLWYNECDHIT